MSCDYDPSLSSGELIRTRLWSTEIIMLELPWEMGCPCDYHRLVHSQWAKTEDNPNGTFVAALETSRTAALVSHSILSMA